MALFRLQCIEESCRQVQAAGQVDYACAACGGLLEVACDFASTDPTGWPRLWRERRGGNQPADRSGVWRFRELLPFGESGRGLSLGEGSTPLLPLGQTAAWAGLARLSAKHQGQNPTGSFKDLGMAVCLTRAVEQRVPVVACASTGNTAASMAAYAAHAGLSSLLCVPAGQVSEAKLAQALDFGARVLEVGESFDQAFALLRAVAGELGLYLVNSVNPFRLEGQKTLVVELLEQRDWLPPDYIALPGGNLGNTSAIGKGLRELHQLGLLTKVPRLVVVQAAGASPFYRTLAAGSEELLVEPSPETAATAIRIGRPANWKKARRVLEWSRGLCEVVTDEEIFQAKAMLAAEGIGCEPASAAAVAALRKLRRAACIEPEADVVAILTGHQLKDLEAIRRAAAASPTHRLRVEPEVGALRRALEPLLASVR